MREEKSIKNSITSVLSNFFVMLFNFITQSFFIKTLGSEYLGLNGLYTNILTMLSFFELGIGSAIVFHLYSPIAHNDKEKIKSLMFFYKKMYTYISLLIFFVGLCIMPFLKGIVGDISITVNIYIIYLMYLINTSSSYLLSYKKNIIQADQKGYILNIVHIFYVIILNCFQIFLLLKTHNYYLFLILKFFFQLLENIIDYCIAVKLYPYLRDKSVKSIDKITLNDIKKKVKALFFHQIGSSVINGTDNIIISSFLGVTIVGLYSNYYMIINAVNILCKQFITATTSSVGNLLSSSKSFEKKFEVFDNMRFINFILSCVSANCILLLIQPFIVAWIGEKYLLGNIVVIVLVINYFQKTQRSVYQTFKDSAGIWYEDRYIPLIEAFINIIVSIVCVNLFGLSGVFVGTIVSGLLLWLYSYPKYVYTVLFKKKYSEYYLETIKYILLFVFIAICSVVVSALIYVKNMYLRIIINLFIAIFIPMIIILIIYHSDTKFIYLKELFIKLLKKIERRN